VALDLESKDLTMFKAESGTIAGSFGPAVGPDGTLYVATTSGEMVALEPKTLKIKDTYAAGEPFGAAPVIFDFKGRTLVAGAARSGALHLLDAAALGGADHKTPLYKSNGGSAATALASWQDLAGTRWLLASTAASVAAWKVADQSGALSLESGWTSRELASPLAPVIVNGVAFTASTGSAPVLYALDASTGKDMWNSGKKIAAPVHGGGVSVGNSQVYLGTDDGTLYVFGFPIEH
jgi:outer membrane protein assembly factor BamB